MEGRGGREKVRRGRFTFQLNEASVFKGRYWGAVALSTVEDCWELVLSSLTGTTGTSAKGILRTAVVAQLPEFWGVCVCTLQTEAHLTVIPLPQIFVNKKHDRFRAMRNFPLYSAIFLSAGSHNTQGNRFATLQAAPGHLLLLQLISRQ